jgi:3-methyladenine DNA glycosylase AlkC
LKPLKETVYTPEMLNDFAAAVRREHPAFATASFLRRVFTPGWDKLELKQRMRHVTVALHDTLARPYPEAAGVVGRAAAHGRGFAYLSLSDYVEVYGLDDLAVSLEALKATTIACSSEFAVRPFLKRYPQATITAMRAWAADSDERVRRLASEGSRPRLPWGMALPAFKEDPSPTLPILERLRDDPSETVRRSVANHLNDISKDNPEVFLDLARRWKGERPETDKMLKHAARTLLKAGHPDAVRLFGFGGGGVKIRRLRVKPDPVRIGGRLHYAFDAVADQPTLVRIECVVYYRKKNGSHTRKTFKITETELEGTRTFERRLSFKDLSTRRHYPGPHHLSIMVNGRETRKKRFEVA